MEQTHLGAYDLPERVASYDADMAIMHPNRAKMVEVALEVLPFAPETPLRALDLGVGTGYFTHCLLQHFGASQVVAVDVARAMLEMAQARLGLLAGRVDFRLGDFRQLASLLAAGEEFDVVFSSYALHHLNRDEKSAVVAQCLRVLRPGGWFLNADLIVAESAMMEQRIQKLRVQGIVARAAGSDDRFRDATATRQFLDGLEARDGDQPRTIRDELALLEAAGLRDVSLLWLEYREAVWGGRK
ncbi:MAG: class I SAM-dependent methyltransferase [Armatimonadetes bacterium]|nr:class I SAM-dependent methyltransferase [Armatimonadota bacterium]